MTDESKKAARASAFLEVTWEKLTGDAIPGVVLLVAAESASELKFADRILNAPDHKAEAQKIYKECAQEFRSIGLQHAAPHVAETRAADLSSFAAVETTKEGEAEPELAASTPHVETTPVVPVSDDTAWLSQLHLIVGSPGQLSTLVTSIDKLLKYEEAFKLGLALCVGLASVLFFCSVLGLCAYFGGDGVDAIASLLCWVLSTTIIAYTLMELVVNYPQRRSLRGLAASYRLNRRDLKKLVKCIRAIRKLTAKLRAIQGMPGMPGRPDEVECAKLVLKAVKNSLPEMPPEADAERASVECGELCRWVVEAKRELNRIERRSPENCGKAIVTAEAILDNREKLLALISEMTRESTIGSPAKPDSEEEQSHDSARSVPISSRLGQL